MSLVQLLIAALTGVANPVGEAIAFKNSDVLVVDSAGMPLFRSSRDHLLKIARNPGGLVIRADAANGRVLVSGAGPEYWVRCAELAPLASCPASPPRPATRSIKIPRGGASGEVELAARGVPVCPGDPRCPKSD